MKIGYDQCYIDSFKKEFKLFLLDSQASWTTLICYLALFI